MEKERWQLISVKQEPCEDAIDRKLVCAFIDGLISDDGEREKGLEYIRYMPSVTPQYTDAEIQKMQELEQAEIEKAYELGKASQQETGHWIWTLEDWNKWECSECGFTKRTDVHVGIGYKFCPNCGAKMESEVSDADSN